MHGPGRITYSFSGPLLFDIIQSEERKLCRPRLRREGAFMDRGAWILIMVLFIAVLVGSYWFLLAPAGQGEEQDDE